MPLLPCTCSGLRRPFDWSRVYPDWAPGANACAYCDGGLGKRAGRRSRSSSARDRASKGTGSWRSRSAAAKPAGSFIYQSESLHGRGIVFHDKITIAQ